MQQYCYSRYDLKGCGSAVFTAKGVVIFRHQSVSVTATVSNVIKHVALTQGTNQRPIFTVRFVGSKAYDKLIY